MAPLKRKRPHDAIPEPEPPAPQQPAATRRATRQTSIAPLPAQPDPEPRRRRRRADSDREREPEKAQASGKLSLGKPLAAVPAPQPLGGKENIPLPAAKAGPLKPNRKTTRLRGVNARIEDNTPPVPASSDIENIKPTATFTPIPPPTIPPRSSARPRDPPNRRAKPVEPPQQPTVSRPQPVPTAVPVPVPPMQPQQKQSSEAGAGAGAGSGEKGPSSRPDRNIDKVVFGNICFRAWYPSYYGKEVLGDLAGNSAKGINIPLTNGTNKEENGVKGQGRRDRENPPMLDRLYVCPSCFKYSKELVTWWEHVRVCETQFSIPGKKIYTHPKGRRKVLLPATGGPKSTRGKRGSSGTKMVEGIVQDEGEWSIWEVDGEQDVLFCQNLSLFAKLFLDNKSVFFDVTGFNYFLLVYTPPSPTAAANGDAQPRKQIVGFFSKEKLSWDNNNLACILIFPPWQRKGLGSLLMGISYEISRREGVLGGPEKPISDLGKKGYKRFWAGEISRWFLGLDTTSGEGEEETVVDAEECSKGTWIAPEDCLQILREMGVVEDAGMGPPRGQTKALEGDAESEEPDKPEKPDVPRVKLSKEAVRGWVAANGISLERACDPDGFIDGYALQPVVTEEEEDDGSEE